MLKLVNFMICRFYQKRFLKEKIVNNILAFEGL